jgi:HlyD family secretion protein
MIKFLKKHKLVSGLIILVIVAGGYYGYQRVNNVKAETRYVVGTVSKDTIITTVSGSGQISASNQVDIKPKASGDVIKVAVQAGQTVKAGDLLVQLDPQTAQKAVRDAEVNLQTAKLSLQKLVQPATAYQLLQATNALTSAQDTLTKLQLSQGTDYQKSQNTSQQAQDNLNSDYNSAFNNISSTFLNLPTIINDLNNILYSNDIGASESSIGKDQWNVAALMNSTYAGDQLKLQTFQDQAEADYKAAQAKYDTVFNDYKNAGRYSDQTTIDNLLTETLDATKAMAQAAKSESNYLDAWTNSRTLYGFSVFAKVTAHQTSLATYISQTNSSLISLTSSQATIQSDKQAIINAVSDLQQQTQNNPLDLTAAQDNVKQAQASLDQLKAGADPLDIKNQQLAIVQRQNALTDALQQLDDYSVRAPFDGTIAVINVKVGDTASSGTAVATIITPQMVAEISLNEVDAAKISVGQAATLTFDAIPDLDITGKVGEVDTLGTVSQGVVTYNVKIALDTQDNRIKSGMSVTANIITNVHQDVLVVPNSAIKTSGNSSYVEVPNEQIDLTAAGTSSNGIVLATPPRRQVIQVGLANDTNTEVTSGLNEGDQIVTRTIAASTAATTAQSGQSLFNLGGGGNRSFGGGGAAATARPTTGAGAATRGN